MLDSLTFFLQYYAIWKSENTKQDLKKASVYSGKQLYIISHFWLDWIDQKAFDRNYYVICIQERIIDMKQ